jgi:hypothetical protein
VAAGSGCHVPQSAPRGMRPDLGLTPLATTRRRYRPYSYTHLRTSADDRYTHLTQLRQGAATEE